MVTKMKAWWFHTCLFCQVIHRVMSIVFSVVVIGLSLYGSYQLVDWWRDGSPVIEFGAGDITPSEARPGERLVAHLNIKKLRNCDGEIRRIVTGDCGHHVIAGVKSSLEEGFNGQLTYPFQLPFEAIPGHCEFRIYAQYWCNPFDLILHRQVFVSRGIPFKVKGWTE